jgi:dihydrofolate synthase/folylpolyglutamate synthase
LDGALAWLAGHVDYERTAPTRRDVPTLEPIHRALHALGDPHHDVEFVHVTGTNGKGSTTAMTAALLEGSGRRVGTFTSPDLHTINERITVAGAPIDDDELAALLARLESLEATLEQRLTRFELLTVGALLHFADEAVDVAVVEVGLGGTWDATNVIDARVAVVTNVALDHTEVLGDTVEAIARDKIGIAKAGSICVLGDPDPTTVELQARLASTQGASSVWRNDHEVVLTANGLALGGRVVSVHTPVGTHEDVLVTLHGRHQGPNAMCAIAAAEAFGNVALDDDVVVEALGSIRVPGRMEVLSTRPLVLVDGAHNPAGVAALAESLAEEFNVVGTKRAVIGVLSNRDPTALLEPLAEVGVEVVYCCRADTPRALDPSAIARAARSLGMEANVVDDVGGALDAANADADPEDLIVVAGSFYVVGAARAHALGLPPHRG